MAKVIDTRVDGRGLKYTAYDTKLVDYAKAPTTGIDPDKKFKIGKPKTLEKPGEVEYFGEEFKAEAEKLAAANEKGDQENAILSRDRRKAAELMQVPIEAIIKEEETTKEEQDELSLPEFVLCCENTKVRGSMWKRSTSLRCQDEALRSKCSYWM